MINSKPDKQASIMEDTGVPIVLGIKDIYLKYVIGYC